MFNRKGEVSTIVILGTLVVIGIAALMSSTVNNQRNTTDTRAADISCKNNPVPPPEGGYTWVANCASTCTTNADCPKNTADPGNVNPDSSSWCYGFAGGARCMQLQKGNISNPIGGGQAPTTQPNGQPSSPSAASGAKCDKVEGCGGACNPDVNSGCGYYGCRFWEWCSPSGTCIDTTNGNGDNPPGPNACMSKSDPGGGNVLPSSPPQSNPTQKPIATGGNSGNPPINTPTTSPNTTDGKCTYIGDTDCITLTPKPTTISCRPGQTKCLSGECVDFQDDCPTGPPLPNVGPKLNPNSPTPTPNNIFLPLIGNLFPQPTAIPVSQEPPTIVTSEKITELKPTADKFVKTCIQSYQSSWEGSDWAPCFVTTEEFTNLLK